MACPVCPACGGSLKAVALIPDQRFSPDAPARVRIVCQGCGRWWVDNPDDGSLVLREGRVPLGGDE